MIFICHSQPFHALGKGGSQKPRIFLKSLKKKTEKPEVLPKKPVKTL